MRGELLRRPRRSRRAPRRASRLPSQAAIEQQAKSFELRAATGARPAARSNAAGATRRAPCSRRSIDWFTEGHTTQTSSPRARPSPRSTRADQRTPPLPVERVLEDAYAFLHPIPDERTPTPEAAPRPLTSYGASARRPLGALPVGRRRAQRQLRTRRAARAGAGRRARQVRLPVDGVRRRLHRRMAVRVAAHARRTRPTGPVSRRSWRGASSPTRSRGCAAYIKFLDPRTGLLSADVWTLGGTMLRNLLVNWMVLIPLIAAAAMLPRIYLGLLGLPSQPELVSPATLDWWYLHDWIPIVILIAIGTPTPPCSCRASGHRAGRFQEFRRLVSRRRSCSCSFCCRCTASGRGGSATPSR